MGGVEDGVSIFHRQHDRFQLGINRGRSDQDRAACVSGSETRSGIGPVSDEDLDPYLLLVDNWWIGYELVQFVGSVPKECSHPNAHGLVPSPPVGRSVKFLNCANNGSKPRERFLSLTGQAHTSVTSNEESCSQ